MILKENNSSENKTVLKVDTSEIIEKTKEEIVKTTDDKNKIEMKLNTIAFNEEYYIPQKKPDFVPSSFTSELGKIISSKKFFPVYITGPSGIGKNINIEQVCSKLNRGIVATSITEETSTDDLIGCWSLVNGDTVWKDGPIVFCAKHGFVCVLDEIDLATPKIMCLQSILNGDNIYIPQTGEKVVPTKGFNIVATGNTKGFGESDIYIGTQALNEAFLERFKITFEHTFPTELILSKIINKKLNSLSLKKEEDKNFGEILTKYIFHIFNAYKAGSIQYYISNRRLIFILEAYEIFGNKLKALQYVLGRFPKEIIEVFLSLYVKMDSSIDVSITDILNNLNTNFTDESDDK